MIWRILKWVIGLGVLLVLLVGAAAVFIYPPVREHLDRQAEANKGELVEVEAVRVGDLVRTITAPGVVKPRTQVQISSRVSTEIIRLPLLAGDQVQKGDVLCELDPKELEARLAAARAGLLADEAALKASEANLIAERLSLDGLRATLEQVTLDLERQQELFARGATARSTLEAAQAEYERQNSSYESRLRSLEGVAANVEASRARVKVAQADVVQAEENLSYTVIRSPMDGVVTVVNSREGENVLGTAQNAGTVIMVVADMSELLIEAQLSEIDAPRVTVGQDVLVEINGFRDEKFKGVLRRVGLETKLDQNGVKYFDAEVLLAETQGRRIGVGVTASVEIEIETFANTLLVPSQAVVDKRVDEIPARIRENNPHVDEDRTFARVVYVFKDGKVQMTPVSVRSSNLTSTALAGGVEAGVEIVVGPYRSLQALEDGGSVQRMSVDAAEGQGATRLPVAGSSAGAGA